MHKKLYLLLVTALGILYLLAAPQAAIGQRKIIRVDTTTRFQTEPLPFDEEFTLVVPLNGDKVTFINLVPHKGRKSLAQSIRYYIQSDSAEKARSVPPGTLTKGTYPLPELPSRAFEVRTDPKDKKNYLHIYMERDLVLPANKRFSFIYSTGPGKKAFGLFDQFDAYRRETNAAEKKKKWEAVTKSYYEIADGIDAKLGDDGDEELGFTYNYTLDLEPKDTTKLGSDYDKFLRKGYDTLHAREANHTVFIRSASGTMLPAEDPRLLALGRLVATGDTTLDNTLRANYLVTEPVLQSFNTLVSWDTTRFQQVLSGLFPLNCADCEPAKTFDVSARSKNLVASVDALRKLQLASQLLASRYSRELATGGVHLHEAIEQLIQQFRQSQNRLKAVAAVRGEIAKNITDAGRYDVADALAGHSYIMSFETRNKFSIVPDFGIVNTSLFKPGREVDYKLIPYLGFHVNFAPVNKDLPFRSYKPSLGQYWSFMLGWSLVSLSKANKTENFFEKQSLLMGLGFRLGNAAKIVAGGVWYFKLDPNSTNRKFAAMPFVGLSLDLELKSFMNGFVGDVLPKIGASKSPAN